MWVTLPSAGETMTPGSLGMVRSGSRKNQPKKAAKSSGGAAHQMLVKYATNPAAASSPRA